MKRREFLEGAAGLAAWTLAGSAQAAVREGALTVDGHALPDWAVAIIREGVSRVRAWAGNDVLVTFPVVTDIHSHVSNAAEPDYRDSKVHIVFQRTADMMIDLVAVKPALRQVHVFRFGCGGPRSEQEYTF